MAIQSRQIIKDNGYEDTITVIQSKVEDITELPDGCQQVCKSNIDTPYQLFDYRSISSYQVVLMYAAV